MTTIYRNYMIARVGDKFVAQSRDDECILVSSQQRRVHNAIDDLWSSLERGVEPAWFSGSTSIDLDTFGPESVPSSGDPPEVQPPARAYKVSYLAFALTAFAVAAPASYAMAVLAFPRQVDVMLSIGVCAVAVAFGKQYALIAAAIVALVYNLFAVEPLLTVTLPTASEFAFSAFNFLAAVGIPELLKLRGLQEKRERGRTGGT